MSHPHVSTNTQPGPGVPDGVRSGQISMEVTWLMENPFCATAPPGERGDFVQISDGRATIYLLPDEFDHADERRLRWLLAQQPTRAS
jgi:hypothetical protein